MWHLLYNVVLVLASPVILLILVSKQRCRRGLPQRLGLHEGSFGLSRLFSFLEQNHPNKPDEPNKPVIWVHAVSLGEAAAVVPLVKELHRRHPEFRFMVSTVTETGREAVEQRLAGIAEHFYAPLDFPWVVSGSVAHLRPALYLFVETELWPNLLRCLSRSGIPAIMVNGRLSTRSFTRQRWGPVRSFYQPMVRSLRLCLMQSDRDVERIVALGADPHRARRTGNIKFDQPIPAGGGSGVLRASLALGPDDLLIVAGSTHAGEEEALVECYRTINGRYPAARLILAPRHIERSEQVEAMIRARGLTVRRRSTIEAGGRSDSAGSQVLVLDSRGELAAIYQEAVATFVGGTLVPVGGHNLLEPAVWAKPVLFGPYTDHCAEIADLLLQAGGGSRVMDEADLTGQMIGLFDRVEDRLRMGRAARAVVEQNQGALQATIEAIESVLRTTAPNTSSILSDASVPLMAGR